MVHMSTPRRRPLIDRWITKPRVLLIFACVSICITLSCVHMSMYDIPTQISDVDLDLLPDLSPSLTWLSARKKLLANKDRVSKLVLYTYMRGGSSIFSQLFNIEPDSTTRSTVLFFEPLDSFYSMFFGLRQFNLPLWVNYYANLTRRIPSEFELSQMTQFLENVLSCDIDKLPIEMLGHRQFTLQTTIFADMWWHCLPPRKGPKSLFECTESLADICGGADIVRPNITEAIMNRCPETIQALRNVNPGESDKLAKVRANVEDVLGYKVKDNHLKLFLKHHRCIANQQRPVRNCWEGRGKKYCANANLVVAKLIRASLANLDQLIQRVPDIRVIYYARDPRATATSRVQNGSKLMFTAKNRDPLLEARALCTQMRDDIRAKRLLERKYPGVMLTLRYEDFIADTERVAKEVFGFVERPLPGKFHEWVQKSLHAQTDNGIFGKKRRNATTIVTKWRTLISEKEARIMTGYCKDVLDYLGYTYN